MANQYTPEDVPTVLRRMFSDAIKLGESWEADGNKFMEDFEHGKFITESLDEWAYNFSALAAEYESIDTTCVICGTECPVTLVRWGDHVGQLSPKQMDKQIPACKDCTQKESQVTKTTSTSFRNNPSDRREWRDYWKDYTDDLAIPEDWEDVTYHNDELPCFQFNNYRIWLNAPTLEERRATLTEQGYNPDEEEDWRFQIDQLDKDGCVLDTLDDIAVLRTLDFDEVVRFVSKPRV